MSIIKLWTRPSKGHKTSALVPDNAGQCLDGLWTLQMGDGAELPAYSVSVMHFWSSEMQCPNEIEYS